MACTLGLFNLKRPLAWGELVRYRDPWVNLKRAISVA